MPKSFSQIKTSLGDWVNIPATDARLPASVRGDAINFALREIARKFDSRFGETSDTFATVASPVTRDYALPSLWKKPHTLWYIHPTNASIVFLDYKTKEEFDALFPDSSKTALPTHYTVWGSNIQLGKSPDRVLTINRNYQAYFAELSADDDTNGLLALSWEVAMFNAFEYVEIYGIEDERIVTYKQKGIELLDQLIIEHAQARDAGRKAQSEEPE